MRACFSDNAELPITCAHDIGETHNCLLAERGVTRDDCQYWQPERAVNLAREILGIDLADTKKCFGPGCRGCGDFFACEEHFPREFMEE